MDMIFVGTYYMGFGKLNMDRDRFIASLKVSNSIF